jgi:hypothetical protein
MMDQLVQELSQKTGLSQDKSQEVVNVVVNHLKAKLPEPVGNAMDSYLNTGSVDSGTLTEAAKAVASGLGGMFGKS